MSRLSLQKREKKRTNDDHNDNEDNDGNNNTNDDNYDNNDKADARQVAVAKLCSSWRALRKAKREFKKLGI